MSTNWRPDPGQLSWTQNLIRGVRDGAMWVAPAMGRFIFDKPNRVLRMVEKFDPCDEELLERTKVTFNMCGWSISEEYDVDLGGGRTLHRGRRLPPN